MKKVFFVLLTLLSFSFAQKVLVIDVEGMTCKVCPIAVRKAILEVKGVKWVKTSLKNRVAVVVAEDYVEERSILRAIMSAGAYRGKVIGRFEFEEERR